MTLPSGDTPLPFLDLPLDMQREIVEVAATEEQRTAVAMSTVSHTWHTWVARILYHSVLLREGKPMTQFLQLITWCRNITKHSTARPRSEDPLGLISQMSVIGTSFATTTLCRMALTHCSNLTRYTGPIDDARALVLVPWPRLRLTHLGITRINHKGVPNFVAPSVTHFFVDIRDISAFTPMEQHFPSLTHCAVGMAGFYFETVVKMTYDPRYGDIGGVGRHLALLPEIFGQSSTAAGDSRLRLTLWVGPPCPLLSAAKLAAFQTAMVDWLNKIKEEGNFEVELVPEGLGEEQHEEDPASREYLVRALITGGRDYWGEERRAETGDHY